MITQKQIDAAHRQIIAAQLVLKKASEDAHLRDKESFLKLFEKRTDRPFCIGALFKLNLKSYLKSRRWGKYKPGMFQYRVLSLHDDLPWTKDWTLRAESTNQLRQPDFITITHSDLRKSRFWSDK